LPTSGKTTRAKQLQAYLESKLSSSKSQHRLHYISDDTLSISRTVYDLSPDKVPAHTRSANASEKDARAAIYGAVKRVLSDKDIVILDGANYIKGWRYQLHCEAKAMSTPSCILQIGCMKDQAREVNDERLRQRDAGTLPEDAPEPYEPENWENLCFRYEEPNPMTRWDSPLFPVIWQDDEAQTRKTFDQIWESIAGEGRKTIRPNQATQQRGYDAGGDYLYMLDKETQDIVKRILDQQGDEGGGGVKIPLTSPGKDDQVIELPAKKLGLPQLQRMRRAFVQLNRGGIGLEMMSGSKAADGLRVSFASYLNSAFEQDE